MDTVTIERIDAGVYRVSAGDSHITVNVRELRDIAAWVSAHQVDLNRDELWRIEREQQRQLQDEAEKGR
jgi:hypothetical protein